MLIWDYIRDFLVQNIFGGTTSDGDYVSGMIGNFNIQADGEEYFEPVSTSSIAYFKLGEFGFEGDWHSEFYISLGDWLSTTTTIIIMALAVVLMCLLVRWVWRVVSSAMLLK